MFLRYTSFCNWDQQNHHNNYVTRVRLSSTQIPTQQYIYIDLVLRRLLVHTDHNNTEPRRQHACTETISIATAGAILLGVSQMASYNGENCSEKSFKGKRVRVPLMSSNVTNPKPRPFPVTLSVRGTHTRPASPDRPLNRSNTARIHQPHTFRCPPSHSHAEGKQPNHLSSRRRQLGYRTHRSTP